MYQQRSFRHSHIAGFTFLELIFVVIILGTLVSMAVLNFPGIQEDTKEEAAWADLKTLQAAIKIYYLENNSFPANLTALVTGGYMDELPADKYGNGTVIYHFSNGGTTAQIWSVGPDGGDDSGNPDDLSLTFGP